MGPKDERSESRCVFAALLHLLALFLRPSAHSCAKENVSSAFASCSAFFFSLLHLSFQFLNRAKSKHVSMFVQCKELDLVLVAMMFAHYFWLHEICCDSAHGPSLMVYLCRICPEDVDIKSSTSSPTIVTKHKFCSPSLYLALVFLLHDLAFGLHCNMYWGAPMVHLLAWGKVCLGLTSLVHLQPTCVAGHLCGWGMPHPLQCLLGWME